MSLYTNLKCAELWEDLTKIIGNSNSSGRIMGEPTRILYFLKIWDTEDAFHLFERYREEALRDAFQIYHILMDIVPRPGLEDFLMVKTTNGIGLESTITYDRLNTRVLTYSRTNIYDSPTAGGDPNQNPYNIFNNSSFVVQTISQPNGIGGTMDLTYSYKDAVYHPLRGFLGFKKVTETNTSTNLVSETVRDIDVQFLMPHIVNQYTYHASSQPITSATITDEFIRLQPSNPLDKRLVHHINKTLTLDEITGAALESVNIYDDYNNVITNTTTRGALVNGTVSPVETTTTTTVYGMHGTPVPASPESITLTNARSGQSAFSKKTDFTYDNVGNVLTKMDFSGRAKAITTTNTHDGFGNIIEQNIAASGVTPRVQKFTYDNTGRFLTQKEIVGTDINQKTLFTYEPALGNIATQVSPDGLTTSYTYDGFGRI